MTELCSRCVMGIDIPGITLDEDGICNHCRLQEELEEKYPNDENGKQKLNKIITKIKKDGETKKYDSLIGISGGVDSTYLLYLAKKEFGLNPLALSVDNHWDDPIASENVKNALRILNVDFIKYELDWNEFKDLQLSFLNASVPDVEAPTDHAIKSVMFKIAAENNIRYILTGGNFRTEGRVPTAWTYNVNDWRYIKNIHKQFGYEKLDTYPHTPVLTKFYYTKIKNIKIFRPLNFIKYDKDSVKKFLHENLGWTDYGGKHYESIYTRFIQTFLLPKKFDIDKRRTHYSALIRSGQLERDEALKKLEAEPPYPEESMLEDKKIIINKFEIDDETFEIIFNKNPKTFLDYPSNYQLMKVAKRGMDMLRKIGVIKRPQHPMFYEIDQLKNDIKK